MVSSWVIYLTTILLTTIIVGIAEKKYYSNKSRRINTKLYFFALLLPASISAIRYDVGTDYMNYYMLKDYYDLNTYINIFDYIKGIEFIPLNILFLGNLFNNEYLFFFITSFMVIFILFLALYKRKNYLPLAYAVFMYLCIEWGSTFNGIRQHMAVVFVLLAYNYLEKKDTNKYIFLTILGGLCHKTAYITFIVYPLVFSKIKKMYKVLLILGCIAVIAFYDKFLVILSGIDSLAKYSQYTSTGEGIGIGVLITNLPLLTVIYIYRKKLIEYRETNYIYIVLIIVGFLLTNLGYLSPFVSRIAWYFSIAQIILIPQLICLTKNKLENLVVKVGIVLYSLGTYIYIYGLLGNHDIFPYQTIFR